MFGPDTDLIFGAMQMAGVVAAVTGGIVYLVMRRNKKRAKPAAPEVSLTEERSDLEERVRVLERIATDRPVDLAEEIEALRETAPQAAKTIDGVNS